MVKKLKSIFISWIISHWNNFKIFQCIFLDFSYFYLVRTFVLYALSFALAGIHSSGRISERRNYGLQWVHLFSNMFLRIKCESSSSINRKLILLFETIKVMGKAEGHGENWHGHVTALTVSPDYRRLGLAAMLMKYLEDVSEK